MALAAPAASDRRFDRERLVMHEPSASTPASDSVEACLANIERLDATLRANITVLTDDARQQARRSDEALARGEWLGVLHGMPIAVKDNIDTKGIRTTSGSTFFADRVPDRDAPVVERLLSSGAIIVAKANMSEFAIGATSQNPHYGGVRNPWDTDRIPGGSSGGSGVAVAAEMAVAALGTDTSGSVRIPAAMNGVAGMRPTTGRVPNRGTTPASLNFDAIGPLAYSVVDTARVLAVIQGYDPADHSSAEWPAADLLTDLHRGVRGLRIGVPTSFFFDGLEPGIETTSREALDVLSDLGAHLVDIHVEGAEIAADKMRPILHADLAAFHRNRLSTAPGSFGEDVYRRIRLGLDVTGAQYSECADWRQAWARQVDRLFEDVDLIVSPVMPVATPLAEGAEMIETTKQLSRFTMPWSMADLPSLSVPCGFDAAGMPVGLQLAGRRWTDARVLRSGVAYQEVTQWHRERPSIELPDGAQHDRR